MKTKSLNELTSNQYYGGMNNRFNRRYILLKKVGFKYSRAEGGAIFTRVDPYSRLKTQIIHASFVQAADNRYFIDTLARYLVRSYILGG